MERSNRGPTLSELMENQARLEMQLRDMMTILAAIAYLQDDKMFTVAIEDITRVPPGSSVDFSFNRKLDQYEFTYVAPKEPVEQKIEISGN